MGETSDTKMNILQVTLAFPPAYAWGGPVKTVYLSCKELVRRGHRVTVYCSNLLNKKRKIQPRTFEREIDGIRAVYFNAWHIPWWPGTLGPVWLPEIKAYLEREISGFDVIHINCYRNLLHLPVIWAARKKGVPYIIQPRGTMPIIINSFWVKHLYDRLLGKQELEGLSALIALQESEMHQAIEHDVPRERIVIIPNGVDFSERQKLPEQGTFRRRYGIDKGRPLILFLARINKKKGTDMLVDAFAQINPLIGAHLVIAGPDDGQLNKVQDIVRHYRLEERVLFTGLLSHEEVMAAFQDADLFVLPCRTDTFPMAIIEACLAETPMVITDRCEIAHLVKNQVAEVVPFDPKPFAEAMEELLVDREKYDAFKKNCCRMVHETFSLQAVVDNIEALYRKIISNNYSYPLRKPDI